MEHLCCKCQKYKIANKRYMLCTYCNFERTHDGMSVLEWNKKKTLDKKSLNNKEERRFAGLKDPLLLPKNRLCKVIGCHKSTTGKKPYCTEHTKVKKKNKEKTSQQIHQEQVKNDLRELKNNAKKEWADKTDGKCQGCLKNKGFLDYSHILSVGQRKDLELDPNNKNLLCRSCHQDWESWNPEKMFNLACIDYNLKYVRENDESSFWRLYFKCSDQLMMNECKKMEEIDQNYKITQNGRDSI